MHISAVIALYCIWGFESEYRILLIGEEPITKKKEKKNENRWLNMWKCQKCL
jgi:hypothetical protein